MQNRPPTLLSPSLTPPTPPTLGRFGGLGINFSVVWDAIWDQLQGQATWQQMLGKRRDAFSVKLTEIVVQRTADEPNQQACSKSSSLQLLCSFPRNCAPKKRQKWTPQSSLNRQGQNVVIKAEVGPSKYVWCCRIVALRARKPLAVVTSVCVLGRWWDKSLGVRSSAHRVATRWRLCGRKVERKGLEVNLDIRDLLYEGA